MASAARGRLASRRVIRHLDTLYRGGNQRWAVRGQVQVGTGLRLGAGSTLWSAHGLQIGDFAAIGRRCTVEVDGTIGHFLMTGVQVLIVGRADHDLKSLGTPMLHSTWVGDRGPIAADRVEIGDDVWIGAGSIVLGGVSIGSGAVIGAGSVVSSSLPAFAIAVGNPARQIGVRFSESVQQEHLGGVASYRERKLDVGEGVGS
jgi:acetyltransferase-like isoleucine patch superfamily enzyme